MLAAKYSGNEKKKGKHKLDHFGQVLQVYLSSFEKSRYGSKEAIASS